VFFPSRQIKVTEYERPPSFPRQVPASQGMPENGGGMERLRVFEMKFAIRARKKASRIGFGETSPG
jgi:hypothetical protein